MQLQEFLPAIVQVFLLAFTVISACVWQVFLLAILLFLLANCKLHVFLPVNAGFFTC